MQQSSLGRYIRKGPVAVVAIQPILSVIGKEDIFKAVAVIVANANPLCPPCVEQSGLGGYVCERTVAVVFVESIAGVRRSVLEPPASKDEDVHPPVVVIIEE